MGSRLLETELQSIKIAELQQQLALKTVQLDTVLQLTQAINYNFSNAALFEIYGYLLSTELRIGRFLLYIEESDWRKYSSKGLGAERFAERPDFFAACQQIIQLDEEAQLLYPGFEVLIPVIYKQQPLAYVLIGGFDWPRENHKELFQYIQAVSNILAAANENHKLFQQQIKQEKIQQELSLAAQMQGLLIPDKLPHDTDLEMSAVYLPHRDVGGDYYDVVKFDSGELVFCVADVSGKGIPAAILMSNFQANLRALIHFHPNLRNLVAELNTAVLNITKGDKFITLFIGKLDPRTGLLKYINAGHVPPFLLRSGELTELKEGATILGMFDELPFLHVGKLQLEPGDVLLTYTDGVTEVSDYRGRAFDMKQVGGVLAPQPEESLHTANKRFLEALIKFKGDRNFADDLTVLSLRYWG